MVPLILIPQILFCGLVGVPQNTARVISTVVPATWAFDGINVPYTYPDINNPFLAALDPDNPGYLKERSFFRNGSSLRPATLPAPAAKPGEQQIELPVSSLAPGEYLIEIKAGGDGAEVKELVGFRLVG